jgi:hypothetical protein
VCIGLSEDSISKVLSGFHGQEIKKGNMWFSCRLLALQHSKQTWSDRHDDLIGNLVLWICSAENPYGTICKFYKQILTVASASLDAGVPRHSQ